MSSAHYSGGAPRYPSTMGWSSHREQPPPHPQQGGTGLPPDVQLNLDRLRMYASGSHVTREQSYDRQPYSAQTSAAPVAPSPSWAMHAASGYGGTMAAGPGAPSTPTSPLRSSLKGSNSAAFQSGIAQPPPQQRGFGSPAPTTPTSEDRDARPALNPADQSKDNFNAVVTFLRARYGDDDAAGSVAKLSDADVDGFLECFGQELRRNVAKARGGTTVTIATNEPVLSSSSARKSAENGAASPLARAAKLPETLKEAMALLKDGTHCVKFSSRKGEPAPRFVRVQGRRALVEGEMVAVPHVCWAATEAEEATGQLSLLTLTDLETGPSVRMKRGSDGNNAAVVGPFGTPIPDRHFLTLVFEKRCLDLAFDTEGECRAWEKALWLVIGRNRRMVGGTKQ